ncbi:MAG: hypothetical protein ACRD2J_04270 [Thermoanaerobaculia bacterium]
MLEQLRVMKGAEVGSYYDLDAVLDEVLARYFPSSVRPAIRWGRKIARKRRRSIRLGSYYRPSALIRIHPLLNSPQVPLFFVQSIVFHELLHHVLGAAHDRRFHRHERMFRYHREARAWLRKNLGLLLGSKRHAARVPPVRVELQRAPSPPTQMALF